MSAGRDEDCVRDSNINEAIWIASQDGAARFAEYGRINLWVALDNLDCCFERI